MRLNMRPDRESWFCPRRIAGCQALWLAFFLSIGSVTPVWADHATQLIVQLQPEAAKSGAESQAAGVPWTVGGGVGLVLPVIRTINPTIVVVRLPESLSMEQAQLVAEQLMEDPNVVYAELDRPMRSHAFVPNDPDFHKQWFLSSDLVAEPASNNAQGAWNEGIRGSANVIIAQLDSGFLPHQDLDSSRRLSGYDFIDDVTKSNDGNGRDPDSSDPGDGAKAGECGPNDPVEDQASFWHGLQVAGVIMATADNAVGIAGVDHFARLLPIRVLGKCGGFSSDILAGMKWAVGLSVPGVPRNPNPAKVLNLSLGGEGPCSDFEQQTINEVVATGAVVVASAGNGSGSIDSPANCNNVISVAAVGRDGALADYSNTGPSVTISAPGGTGFDGINTTNNTGLSNPGSDSYATLQGTSVTAPQVTAAVALMLSANPNASAAQIRSVLKSTARAFPDSSCNTSNCGAGLLDIAAAVKAVAGLPLDNSSNTSSGGGGGCTVRGTDHVDPLFPGIVLIACWVLLSRRYRKGFKHDADIYAQAALKRFFDYFPF